MGQFGPIFSTKLAVSFREGKTWNFSILFITWLVRILWLMRSPKHPGVSQTPSGVLVGVSMVNPTPGSQYASAILTTWDSRADFLMQEASGENELEILSCSRHTSWGMPKHCNGKKSIHFRKGTPVIFFIHSYGVLARPKIHAYIYMIIYVCTNDIGGTRVRHRSEMYSLSIFESIQDYGRLGTTILDRP